jgi:hypothetical protein
MQGVLCMPNAHRVTSYIVAVLTIRTCITCCVPYCTVYVLQCIALHKNRLVAGVKIRAIYADEDNDPAWYEATIDSVVTEDEVCTAVCSYALRSTTVC